MTPPGCPGYRFPDDFVILWKKIEYSGKWKNGRREEWEFENVKM